MSPGNRLNININDYQHQSPHTMDRCLILRTILVGTCDKNSALRILRGQSDVLRVIWTLVCEEWWDLHISRYPDEAIADLSENWRDTQSDYPLNRQTCGGCPIATIVRNMDFPAPIVLPMGSVDHQTSERLYVNMMPFSVADLKTLPSFLSQYIPMIERCMRFVQEDPSLTTKTAFLTVDERPVSSGHSQRRGGLHVESPGTMDFKDEIEGYNAGLYSPGVQHVWGNGFLMRDECVVGGIFMASNTADSCAVWNCQIDDPKGDMIGMHGNVERYREILGPATRTLDAGEIVWMTDKTPHESLPLRKDTRRQYFRLVVGEVSVWYADHSTRNPLGFDISQQVIRGDKFVDVYKPKTYGWKYALPDEINRKSAEKELRLLAFKFGVGHLIDKMMKLNIKSITDLSVLCDTESEILSDKLFPEDFASFYYDAPQFDELCTAARQMKGKICE